MSITRNTRSCCILGLACVRDECGNGFAAATKSFCSTDEDCADDYFCDGQEWCDCLCQAGEPPCIGGCDEETDTCLCTGPADCPDDGLFCNGIEFCNPAGTCDHSGDPCGERDPDCPPCNELAQVCDSACTSDAECDDNNPCTADQCDDCGLCLNQPACPAGCDPQTGTCLCNTNGDCPNDFVFCNGWQYCEDGVCLTYPPPCGTVGDCNLCNEATGTCDSPCTQDADCDDGDLCTTDHCDGCSCHNDPACPAGCDTHTGACR